MALSQVQCLDDNHVNWRYSEAKPEFFYSEEQRLALEALLAEGPEAFRQVLAKENIRDFLSELELRRIVDGVRACDPPGEGEAEEGAAASDDSLEYWPDRSDCSIPELDLGWPDIIAYRGVTRATVYMQPPLDGQAHIKEVVRKMVAQAQKVIAVVMDLFTDVDIFKDMLDAGFKRKVAIYIILDESNVKHFLQMCERAQMHAGHLKNLRVRCAGGTEFYTRSTTKFTGALAQKFMFVDGDRAVCGAYSFTWSAARTDRNVITVLTGQVVETFDKQFQELYLNSKGVSLKAVTIQNEPEPELFLQHTAIPVAPAADVAKKLIHPKYALVATKSASDVGVASSDNKCGSKEGSNAPDCKKDLKGKAKATKQQFDFREERLLNVHPALQNMEKANMFDYLPTWVEPDPEPGSEILGYINIVDPNIKNPQLSQINRIKICDTAQAMAQHLSMLQNKEQEANQTQDNRKAPPSPTSEAEKPKVLETTKTDPSSTAPEAPESPKLKVSESPRPKIPELPKVLEIPKAKTPESPIGAFALLAGSHHLHSNINNAPDILKNGKGTEPPVPKPRTVPVADIIIKNNAINESQAKAVNMQENKNKAVKEEENCKQNPVVNGVHKVAETTKATTESKLARASCAQNGVVEDGRDEENEEYVTLSDQDSFSDCSSSTNHYKSNASSISEEYYDPQEHYKSSPIRRRNSEQVPNGEAVHLQRKMSDGHISRGTFVSPLKFSQTMLEMRQEDENYMRRNKALEEEIRRALERSRKQTAVIKGHDRMFSNDGPQGRPVYQHGPRAPVKARVDHNNSQGQNQEMNTGDSYRNDRIGSRPRPGKQGDAPADAHRFWNGRPLSSARQSRKGTASSFQDPQAAPDGLTTPFGIPFSKLSQSQHLRSRLAGHGVESKRRGQNEH
ncbi:protein FAM83G [Rhinatrema bivittatum]|uniref:protein FAM83G n=1 Tax=Rhinatrema bivittatum TaxID=194408 RepID=UPI001126F754|nr:protein FAM83G [Rhinatrema bivittatum]